MHYQQKQIKSETVKNMMKNQEFIILAQKQKLVFAVFRSDRRFLEIIFGGMNKVSVYICRQLRRYFDCSESADKRMTG